MRYVNTRACVQRLLEAGWSQNAIARELGVTKSTVAYHARGLGREPDQRCNRRYDWKVIQRYYDEGHSISDCQAKFGFSRATWNDARQRGSVISRPRKMSLDQLLAMKRNREHLKLRLIGAGLKENRCEVCGLTDWLEKPLAMALHHVNGNGNDNRLENLQFLCPNCHAQTDNYGGRNRNKRDRQPAASNEAE